MKRLLPGVLLLLSPLVLADEGARVYAKWCGGCHSDSPLSPATVLLRATRGDAFALIEERDDLTAEYVTQIVRQGRAGMPSFRRTEISVDALNALAEFLSNSKADSQ